MDGFIELPSCLAEHHADAAGGANAVFIRLNVGAGRAADGAFAGIPVDGVRAVLHDGHGFGVQINALGIVVVVFPDDGAVFRRKIVDGFAVRIAVGPAALQKILQPSDQHRLSEARTGVINAVGVRVGDEGAAADLHLVSAGDRPGVESAVEGAALDVEIGIARVIRHADRPAFCGGDGDILQRQLSVGDRAAHAGVGAVDQLDGVAVAGVFDRAVVEREAISLVDPEHRVAAAGERVSSKIQLLAGDLVGHDQRAVAHVLVAQERHDGIRDRSIARQRILHGCIVLHDLAVIPHQPRLIDALAADAADALGFRADGPVDALVRARVAAGAALAVYIAVRVLGLVADKITDLAAVAVGLAVGVGNIFGGVFHQFRVGLGPVADAGLFVPALVRTVIGFINAVFINTRAVGVIAAQGADLQVLLRAFVPFIAPLVLRAAGDRHGGDSRSVRPDLRITAGGYALDLVVSGTQLVPYHHTGRKRRILARRRQCAVQQPEHRQPLAGEGSAAAVRDGHFPCAAGLSIDGQRFGTPVGKRDAAVHRQARAVAEDDAGHFPGNSDIAVDGHVAPHHVGSAGPFFRIRLDLDIIRRRGGFPVFAHIGHGRQTLHDLNIRNFLEIIVRQRGPVSVPIGMAGREKVHDRDPFVDLAGVLIGQDVDAVERAAGEQDRPLGVFQRHAARGGEGAAADLQRAAVYRDSAGAVGRELLAAISEIRFDRNIVAVYGELALAAHGDRGGLIPLIDCALARDRERAVKHLNDIGRITVRKADVSLRQQVVVQVQRDASKAFKLDLARRALEPFILILRQIHIVQKPDGGGAHLFH